MIRCFKARRPVFNSSSLIKTHIQKFQFTSKNFVRSVSHRDQYDQVVEERIENESSDSLFIPENPNVNFFGIESDVGVKTLSSKISCLQEKTSTKQLREKFYKTSYGVIRYDTDNKLKFHGQYGKRNDFVFPHESNDISEVSQNVSEKTQSTYNQLSNNSNKYNDSSTNAAKKSVLSDKKMSNETMNENSLEDSQEVNYIDQFYFETISGEAEKKSPLVTNHSTDVLNYFDKTYFGHCTETENQSLSKGQSENQSLKDKPILKSNSVIKNDTVNNPSSSSIDDFNFIDKDYFGESNILINKKSCNVEVFQNTDYSSKSNHQNLTSKSVEVNKAAVFNSNESQKTISKNNQVKDTFENMQKSNVNIKESFDSKKIIHKNSDYDPSIKQLDNKILKHDDELNFDSFLENDLFLKENHPLSDIKRKINEDSNIYSHVAASNFPKINVPSQSEKGRNNSIFSKESSSTSSVITAYDFVSNLHKQEGVPSKTVEKGQSKLLEMKVDSKGFRILKNQIQDLSHFTRDEILSLLKQSILYQDDNLLILNKPYSLVIHDSQTSKSPCLSSFLEDLAKEIDGKNFNSKLVTVHRIDKETTGCLLIARNEITAQNLQSLFAQRKIIKKYWVLTSKVPDPPEGLIDIPIAEGSVSNKRRMVLHPEIPKDMAYKNHSRKGKPALTSYKVLSESGNAALVEATPITGIKHQIRVHFGFGLSCPIIGDHKYSHLDKLAPQKLPSDILQRLHVRQSKVRHIPLHIHAKSVTVPGYFENRDLYIQAPLPNHMKENLKRLKFKKK